MPRLPAALLIKALGRVGVEEEQEQQLNGVLRMLGAEIPDKNQLPLFGKPPAGQEPKP
jgi:hypothetical protein